MNVPNIERAGYSKYELLRGREQRFASAAMFFTVLDVYFVRRKQIARRRQVNLYKRQSAYVRPVVGPDFFLEFPRNLIRPCVHRRVGN